MSPVALLVTACTSLGLLAGCPATTGNDPKTVKIDAVTPVDCKDNSADCARQYIDRASACSQVVDTPNVQSGDTSRRCAVQNYANALAHMPASGADDIRVKGLIGLADSLKAIRDNPANDNERTDAQQRLNQTLTRLDQEPGGHPYVQYFVADSLVSQARSRSLPTADACSQLSQARTSLPAQVANQELAVRVNRLRNAIEVYSQTRSCS
jgi:hypothetical protein